MDIFNKSGSVALGRTLTQFQENFIQAYLTCGKVDEAEKSIGMTTGYGDILLTKPHVWARLEEIRSRTVAKTDVTVDYLVDRLQAVVDLDPYIAYETALAVESVIIRHDTQKGQDGISVENVKASLAAIPPEIRKLMDVSFTSKGIQIKFLDKNKAYDMLAKIKGAYAPEKIDLSSPLINNIVVTRH